MGVVELDLPSVSLFVCRRDYGSSELDDGSSQLHVDGEFILLDNGQLHDRSSQLDNGSSGGHDGSSGVDDGPSQVDDGSSQVDDGSSQLDDESSQLDDESSQLDDRSIQRELRVLGRGLCRARAGGGFTVPAHCDYGALPVAHCLRACSKSATCSGAQLGARASAAEPGGCLLYDSSCGKGAPHLDLNAVEDDGTGQVCFAAGETYAEAAIETALAAWAALPLAPADADPVD